MTYKQELTEVMTWLGEQPKTVFLGEGLKNAGDIYGTMTKVNAKKCLEMPICENLIAGAAIGLAMQGYKPIVVFQRMDFMLIAADAIINHMALVPKMSGGQFTLPILIRAIIGSQDGKFDVGLQHNHDFTNVFEPHITTVRLVKPERIQSLYNSMFISPLPTLVIEEKDLYETNHTTQNL